MGNFDDIPNVKTTRLPIIKSGAFDDIPFLNEVKPKKSILPLIRDRISESFRTGVLEDPIFQQKARAASEAASVLAPLFQPVTNVAVRMQEGDFRPKELARTAVRGLPIPRIDPELGPTVIPQEIIPSRKLITNVVKAINPEYQEPEDPISQIALDVAGGFFTGAPQAAATKGMNVLGQAYARSEAARAARTLKNLPARRARLMGNQAVQAIARQPKQLPPPRNLGEGFQIIPREEAKKRVLLPLRKDYQNLDQQLQEIIDQEALTLQDLAANFRGGQVIRPEGASGYRTALPEYIKHPVTGNKPRNAQEFRELAVNNLSKGRSAAGVESDFGELSAALNLVGSKIKSSPFLGEAGFARLRKSFEGMSEAELRKELARLKGGGGKKTGLPVGISIPGGKERGFITTVKEAKKTIPEVARSVQGEYIPITNQATIESAKRIIESNIDDAIRIAKSDAPPTAESSAVSQLLIDRFQNEGRFQDAIDIVEKTAAKATTQGQAIQALAIYARLSPEGILRYTQRTIDKARRSIPGAKVNPLTPDLAQELTAHARRLATMPEGRGKIIETAKLLQKAHTVVPPSLLKKISMAQTLMQLLNPKTAIRNLLGNAGFTAIENISDVVGTAYDKAASIFTGQRTKVLPSLKAQAEGFMRGGKEAIEEVQKGVNISPQTTQFDIPKTGVFQGGIGQKLERVLNYELRVPDRAFYQATYEGSLNNQMRAAKVSIPTDRMKEIAHFDALYRTFQDPNRVSEFFQKVKTGLNKLTTGSRDFGLGDIVIKYPKTPGALLARGIEYSPAGFFKTAIELYRGIKGLPTFSQKALVESGARATVGTGLVGSGILLARLGIITGRKDDRKGIRALKQELGLRDYQINVDALGRFIASGFDPESTRPKQGDKLATYDWFQPQSINLAIGANIEENKGQPKDTVGIIADAIASGGTTLTEQPLLQGVKKLFGYGDLVGGIGEVLKGVPASFVPTLLNQIKLLVDDVARNPEAESPIQETANLVKMRLPGASKTLPPRLTPFGEEKRYRAGEGAERAFNVFLNPAITSKYGESPDADIISELVRLDVTIPEQGRTIRGIPIGLQQRSSIDQFGGRETLQALRSVIRSEGYRSSPDELKEKILEKIIRSSKERSRRTVFLNAG